MLSQHAISTTISIYVDWLGTDVPHCTSIWKQPIEIVARDDRLFVAVKGLAKVRHEMLNKDVHTLQVRHFRADDLKLSLVKYTSHFSQQIRHTTTEHLSKYLQTPASSEHGRPPHLQQSGTPSVQYLMDRLHLLPICARIDFKNANLTYKTLSSGHLVHLVN